MRLEQDHYLNAPKGIIFALNNSNVGLDILMVALLSISAIETVPKWINLAMILKLLDN
jgi:hypothetical protein